MKLTHITAVEERLLGVQSSELIRLIYISKVNTYDDTVFEHIQYHASHYNHKNGIKGFLCNDRHNFLQCLEGSKKTIVTLMSRIFKDPHHTDIKVILIDSIPDYDFADWRMHSLNLNRKSWINHQTPTPIKTFIPFRPDTWSPWLIEHFIRAVQEFDNPDMGNNVHLITFDTLGYRDTHSKLIASGLLFWTFMGLLFTTTFVLILINTQSLDWVVF